MIPPMFFGKMLWVDLNEQTLEEREVEADIYQRRIGGAPLISGFLKDDCIGLSCGPLTGSPAPGAGAAIAAVRKNGRNHYAPLLMNAGLELKMSGFDFVVIEGNSERPVYLWIRDEVADLIDFKNPSLDAWDTIASVRKEQGDPRIKVVSSCAEISASVDYVSGWDGIYFGGLMRSKGLKAIAIKGMSELTVKDHVPYLARCSEMMRQASARVGGRAGIRSILSRQAGDKLTKLRRNRACCSCPFPCMTYADIGGGREMLLMDQRSIESLSAASSPDDLLGSLERFHRNGACSGYRDDILLDTITTGIEPNEMIAAGYVLGLCPRYLGKVGGDISQYCDLLSIATGTKVEADRVMSLGRSLLKEGSG